MKFFKTLVFASLFLFINMPLALLAVNTVENRIQEEEILDQSKESTFFSSIKNIFKKERTIKKKQEQKLSKFALVSLIAGILFYPIFFIAIFSFSGWGSLLLILSCMAIAISFGIIGLVKIRKSHGDQKGKGMAIVGLSLGLAPLVYLLGILAVFLLGNL